MAAIKLPTKFSLGAREAAQAFGIICLVAAVGFALNAGRAWTKVEQIKIPQLELGGESVSTDDSPKTLAKLESYDIISRRNLFKAEAAQPNKAVAQPVSQLKLRLVGTEVSSGRAPFAIIEDGTKNEQDVFEINESLFGQAKLVEIFPESVRIEHNGKIETLLLEEGTEGAASVGGGESPAEDETEFTVPEAELSEALSNLPLLLSQARAVPYFQNGQSVGMRLFAIRRGSMYEKLGLKNGDIVKSINENNLSDPSQALKLFEQLKSERSIGVKLERDGAPRELKYSIR